MPNENQTNTAPEAFVVQLRGGTQLRMPAGRGPASHYDRLFALLDECEVWQGDDDWDAENRGSWVSGKKALQAARVIAGDLPQARNTGEG
jgi:hypothetical protein